MFDQCGYYMSLLQDLVEGACLISVVLYVAAARLGGGGMFDQCGTMYMSLLQDLVEEACLISVVLYVAAARLGGGGMFDQCGYYMSLLQDLVEEACLISVVTICRCCKTWWRKHV